MIKEIYQPRRLITLRIDHGFSQERLARECEVSRQTIVNIEAGVHMPNLGLAHRISTVFGKTIHEVFFTRD